MRLLILSDTHFGFASGTEREQDAFDAVRAALATPADAVLFAGDFFDTRVPSPETFARALELLVPLKLAPATAALSADHSSALSRLGVPVVAIAGNHERRARGLVNPVEALQRAGLLVHLHAQTAVLRKGTEAVAVHGLSWLPDQYAQDALREWAPQPLPGAFNILLLHQNLAPFLDVEPCLRLADLPPGFDFYLNGHIHEPGNGTAHGKPVLIPGSAVPTQLKEESAKPKGFWVLDTAAGLEFHAFPDQRAVHVLELPAAPVEPIAAAIEAALAGSGAKKPVVRVRLTGAKPATLPFADLRLRFEGRCFLSFRTAFDASEPAATLAEHQLSVQERGRQALRERLVAAGLDAARYEAVYELLLAKRPDEALAHLQALQSAQKQP